MNIALEINQFDNDCIYFLDPIKNNIINDSNFIRMIYSNENITFNGIYILIHFIDITCEKYYNKYKCSFNKNINSDLLSKIKIMEENILKKYNIQNKLPQNKIYEQLNTGNIKVFNDLTCKNNIDFVLKISGIWETSNNYGLTYKFTSINNY
jgi:hypothetical protein